MEEVKAKHLEDLNEILHRAAPNGDIIYDRFLEEGFSKVLDSYLQAYKEKRDEEDDDTFWENYSTVAY